MSHGTSGQDRDYEPLTPAERAAQAKAARELVETARANLEDGRRQVRLAEMALAATEANARYLENETR